MWHRPTLAEIRADRRRVSAEELATLVGTDSVNVPSSIGDLGEESSFVVDRVKLTARELSKIREEYLDRVIQLMQMFHTLRTDTE